MTFPSELPSIAPTAAPTATALPSVAPSALPSVAPTGTAPTGTGNCSGQHELTVQIKTDYWVPETTWEVRNECTGNMGPKSSIIYNTAYHEYPPESTCLPAGRYTFTVMDSWGDGIGRYSSRHGYYRVKWDGEQVAYGWNFRKSESTSFGSCPGAALAAQE